MENWEVTNFETKTSPLSFSQRLALLEAFWTFTLLRSKLSFLLPGTETFSDTGCKQCYGHSEFRGKGTNTYTTRRSLTWNKSDCRSMNVMRVCNRSCWSEVSLKNQTTNETINETLQKTNKNCKHINLINWSNIWTRSNHFPKVKQPTCLNSFVLLSETQKEVILKQPIMTIMPNIWQLPGCFICLSGHLKNAIAKHL